MRNARFRFSVPLYPIVDSLGDPRLSHVDLAAAMLQGGARFLQLRIKDRPASEFVDIARAVKQLTDAAGASLIVNDRADIAKLIGAAGVHVGQQDLPAREARAVLGPDKLVGLSTHNLEQVQAATRAGDADYIGYGPIFTTGSKMNPDPVQGLDGLRIARAATALPIVAIGGISEATMAGVMKAGADAVAMIGEIVRASDVAAKVRVLLDQACSQV